MTGYIKLSDGMQTDCKSVNLDVTVKK